jgi:hypothetical protein
MGNYINRFYGLSSDTKPTTVPVGSTFLETDTGFSWVTYDDGTHWVRNTVGEVGHNISTIADNRKTVTTAGTRERLVAASTTCKYVIITALSSNTGRVMIGGSTVVAAVGATSRGVPLNAGEKFGLPADDLYDIYIDSTVNGEGVMFVYLS